MRDIKYRYINYQDKLFEQVCDMRFNILFKPYKKIKYYIYDKLDPVSMHLVAVNDDDVIGYSRLTLSRDRAKITNVVVKESYAKQNIGLNMLKVHINTCKRLNLKDIVLNARINTVNFYKKAGFIESSSCFISDKSGITLKSMFLDIK